MTSALTVDSLSFSYGKKSALSRVSLDIAPGDFTVLLGQNGAGKTTLFSLITRLYNPHSGSVCIFGHDVRTDSADALRQLGVVFQQRTLDIDLTVQQNLLYFTALHGIHRSQAQQRIAEELDRIGLEGQRDEKIRKLSGGQMRRVEIVRALLHQPKLLILDEPTVGLDLNSRQTILEHVRNLCEQAGLALLWATHLIDEVIPTDRVVILHKGEVIASGQAQEIVEQSETQDIREAFQKLTAPPQQRAAA